MSPASEASVAGENPPQDTASSDEERGAGITDSNETGLSRASGTPEGEGMGAATEAREGEQTASGQADSGARQSHDEVPHNDFKPDNGALGEPGEDDRRWRYRREGPPALDPMAEDDISSAFQELEKQREIEAAHRDLGFMLEGMSGDNITRKPLPYKELRDRYGERKAVEILKARNAAGRRTQKSHREVLDKIKYGQPRRGWLREFAALIAFGNYGAEETWLRAARSLGKDTTLALERVIEEKRKNAPTREGVVRSIEKGISLSWQGVAEVFPIYFAGAATGVPGGGRAAVAIGRTLLTYLSEYDRLMEELEKKGPVTDEERIEAVLSATESALLDGLIALGAGPLDRSAKLAIEPSLKLLSKPLAWLVRNLPQPVVRILAGIVKSRSQKDRREKAGLPEPKNENDGLSNIVEALTNSLFSKIPSK